MIAKAEAKGLVFYHPRVSDICQSANIHDELYNSRDGLALYYRYGPRDLPTLCTGKTDPIRIHTSAYKKIVAISDSYAPDGLPSVFDEVDDAGAILAHREVSDDNLLKWQEHLAAANKAIRYRKYLYHLFSELTLLIILIAGYLWGHPGQVPKPIDSCLLEWGAAFFQYVTPVYFEQFINLVVHAQPWISVVMLLILYVMNKKRETFTSALNTACQKMCRLIPRDKTPGA